MDNENSFEPQKVSSDPFNFSGATSGGTSLVLSPLSEHVKDEVPTADDADKFALCCYGYSSETISFQAMAYIIEVIFSVEGDDLARH